MDSDGRNDRDAEAVLAAELLQQMNVASLLMTKAKVFTDQDAADVEVSHKDLLDELFRLEPRQLDGKGKEDDGLESGRGEPLNALRTRGELRRCRLRPEDFAR